jgi:hypothetical protein
MNSQILHQLPGSNRLQVFNDFGFISIVSVPAFTTILGFVSISQVPPSRHSLYTAILAPTILAKKFKTNDGELLGSSLDSKEGLLSKQFNGTDQAACEVLRAQPQSILRRANNWFAREVAQTEYTFSVFGGT